MKEHIAAAAELRKRKPATKAKTLEHINKAWVYIAEVLENKSGFCENYAREYLRAITEEERGHRHFKPDGVTCGLTVPQAARLFAVKRIVEYLDNGRFPTVKDFLHTQWSCFYAAGFVAEFGPDLRDALSVSGADLAIVRAADYAALNR